MAAKMFLSFSSPDVKGESGILLDAVECTSWSYGFDQPINPARSQSGPTIEKCNHQPFTITRKMDKSSLLLMEHGWKGTVFKKVTFQALRSHEDGPIKYLTVVMKYSVISEYDISGSEGDLPEETIKFSFGEIACTYKDAPKKDHGLLGDPVGTIMVKTSQIESKVGDDGLF